MKKTTLAAFSIAALIITTTSCKWFSSNSTSPSIVGKWKIDSLYPIGKDTSLALFFYHLAKKDGDSLMLQFNTDSTFKELPSSNDSTSKRYYVKGSVIFLQEDSTYSPYQLSFKSESMASMLSKDSTYILLKRK